jgi:hypothetical protein
MQRLRRTSEEEEEEEGEVDEEVKRKAGKGATKG